MMLIFIKSNCLIYLKLKVMLKLNVSELKSQFLSDCQHPELSKIVLNKIDDDETVFEYPNDFRDASAGVSGFIYYTDTVKFAKKNIYLILQAVNQFESDCGVLDKPQDDETQYYNWLAWFALENTISDLIRFLED